MSESRAKNSQPDNTGDILTDHPFIAAKDNPYLCGFVYGSNVNGHKPVCRLAEAAHAEAATPYRSTSPRAKPGEAR